MAAEGQATRNTGLPNACSCERTPNRDPPTSTDQQPNRKASAATPPAHTHEGSLCLITKYHVSMYPSPERRPLATILLREKVHKSALAKAAMEQRMLTETQVVEHVERLQGMFRHFIVRRRVRMRATVEVYGSSYRAITPLCIPCFTPSQLLQYYAMSLGPVHRLPCSKVR